MDELEKIAPHHPATQKEHEALRLHFERLVHNLEQKTAEPEQSSQVQHHNEGALQKSERRYRALFENSRDAIALVTRNGAFIDINQAGMELFGYAKDEILTINVLDLYADPDDRARVLKKIIEQGYLKDYEVTFRRKDGTLMDCLVTSALWEEETGVETYQSIIRDITERKRMFEALQRSETRYRQIFNTVSDAICINDSEGNIVEANPQACAMFGYTYEELLSLDPASLIPPNYFQLFCERLKHSSIEPFETVNIRKDGTLFPLEVRTTSIEYEGKKFWLSLMRDITERKRIEENLRKSEAKYRELVENANSIILRFDTQGRITFFNEYAQRFFGYAEKEIINKNLIGTIMLDTDRGGRSLKDALDNVIKHPEQFTSIESTCISRTGQRALIAWTNKAIRNDQGDIVEILSIGNNITDRKRLEEKLRQAQKMEAIGTLAGGIAHDFNNILSAVNGYAELALMKISKDHALYKDLQGVLKASLRARDLVGQILAFSRQREQQKRPIQASIIVKEALKLLRASLPSTIEIRQAIEKAGAILGDPTQIHQIVMNLCTNAAHAMRETGGILEVNLEQVHLNHITKSPDIIPGTYLKMTVSDTGHGIEPTLMDRIFDPYFTTKERGEGTGLGLAVVHGIVKDLGGSITVASTPGAGATFEIYFPVVEQAPAFEKARSDDFPRGTERILFVDDELSLAESQRLILQHLGYKVTSCGSGVEALEIFRSQPESFDLVVSDYTMPRMTGGQLAQELLRIRPQLPIIVCTGYSETIDVGKAKTLGIRALLMKPFITQVLATTMRQILDGKEISDL